MNGVYEIWIGEYYYYGSSIECIKRSRVHLRSLKNGNHVNKKMQNVYNKYKKFEFKIIIECKDRDTAYLYEQEFINTHFGLDKCLNLNSIASKPPSNKGKKLSNETKEKMRSKALKMTDEHKAKIAIANTLRSEDVKKGVSQKMKEYWNLRRLN